MQHHILCCCYQRHEATICRTIHRLQAQRLALEHRVVSGGAELHKYLHTVVQLIPAQRRKLWFLPTFTRTGMSDVRVSANCGCWRGCNSGPQDALGSDTLQHFSRTLLPANIPSSVCVSSAEPNPRVGQGKQNVAVCAV